MEDANDNVVSEVTPDDVQSLSGHAEHKSFRLTGGWKLSRANKKQAKEITLKQALLDGLVVDLILFFVTGMVMCGTFQMIILLAMYAHVSASLYLAFRFKKRISALGVSFIRFGAFYLIFIAIAGRVLIALVFELMNIDWY